MGPGMIYSRLCPWKTQRAQRIPLFLHSIGFPGPFQAVPIFLHPCFLLGGGSGRDGIQPSPRGEADPSHPCSCILLLPPFQWTLPGKGSTETSFNWIWEFFPVDPFPGSFCFQAQGVFEEESDQSSFIPNPKDPRIFFPMRTQNSWIQFQDSSSQTESSQHRPDPASGTQEEILGKLEDDQARNGMIFPSFAKLGIQSHSLPFQTLWRLCPWIPRHCWPAGTPARNSRKEQTASHGNAPAARVGVGICQGSKV